VERRPHIGWSQIGLRAILRAFVFGTRSSEELLDPYHVNERKLLQVRPAGFCFLAQVALSIYSTVKQQSRMLANSRLSLACPPRHKHNNQDRKPAMPKRKKQTAKAPREEKEKPPAETVENPKKTCREKFAGTTW
jgi:hypothetical protein